MLQQRLMWIIWPAFLMAGVLEMLVFLGHHGCVKRTDESAVHVAF